MSDHDIELLKLEMQREAQRADLFKWFVAFIWPFIVNIATAYLQHQAIEGVAAKADVAAVKADVAATKASVMEKDNQEIKAGVDANVKSWKAYQTKDPGDMNTATEAVERVERAAELKKG